MNDFISNALLNISPENACRLAKRYGADFTVDEAKIILPFLRLHKNELKKENKELKNAIKNNDNEMLFDSPLCTIIGDEEISDEELEKLLDELEDLTDEKQDMEIISLLTRSKKRLEVLESLENENKIPSVISKDINDSSHHISKYLKTLKESGLVVCLNENDKRYRYYSITPKGTKYLNIVKNKK